MRGRELNHCMGLALSLSHRAVGDVDHVTLGPRLEDVLGPLAGVIVREVEAFGAASIADILDAMHRTQPRLHAQTTVMTVMSRLHDRGSCRERAAVATSSMPQRHQNDSSSIG